MCADNPQLPSYQTEQTDKIGQQAVRSTAYSAGSSIVTGALGLLRSILLARLLLPEYFGVVAMALFYLDLMGRATNFGLDSAVIYYQQEDDSFLGNYLLLRLGLAVLVTAAGILLAAPLQHLYPSMAHLRSVTIVLALVSLLAAFSQVQEVLLRKQMRFNKLAVVDISSSIVMTIVAPVLAWQGFGIWALVAEQGSGIIVRALLCWGVMRPWNPQLRWRSTTVRWFWSYGWPAWFNNLISYILDSIGNFWVGTWLGGTPLGFYSKAKEYAGYPRRVIAIPLVSVAQPVFARLQHGRHSLSSSFARLSGLLFRIGTGIAAIGCVAAPPFVTLVLGAKWEPMTPILQLLLVYALLEPLVYTAENLLLALGNTKQLARIRLWQLLIFIPVLFCLTDRLGVSGVAVAVDMMTLVGMVMVYRTAHQVVDYSSRILFGWPLLAGLAAAGIGGFCAFAAVPRLTAGQSLTTRLWLQMLGGAASSLMVYAGLLWLRERRTLRDFVEELRAIRQENTDHPGAGVQL